MNIDIEKYNHVIESAHIADVRLIGADFDVKPSYYSIKDEAAENHESDLKHSYGCEITTNIDAERDNMYAFFKWKLDVKKGRKQYLFIKATYIAAFTLKDKVDEDLAKLFMSRVGRTTTYPFFRSLAAMFSNDSKAELPTLPLIKTDALAAYGSNEK